MKIYETINNIRVEVIQDSDVESNCSECCFDNAILCGMAKCVTRKVHFKLIEEDKIVPDATGTVEKYDDFVNHLSSGLEYYRGVCHSVGNLLGIAAYTSDDGAVHDTVLVAKLEELVAELVLENVKLKSKVRSIEVLGK